MEALFPEIHGLFAAILLKWNNLRTIIALQLVSTKFRSHYMRICDRICLNETQKFFESVEKEILIPKTAIAEWNSLDQGPMHDYACKLYINRRCIYSTMQTTRIELFAEIIDLYNKFYGPHKSAFSIVTNKWHNNCIDKMKRLMKKPMAKRRIYKIDESIKGTFEIIDD